MKRFWLLPVFIFLGCPVLPAETNDNYWEPAYAPLDNRGRTKRLSEIEPRTIIDQIPTNITQSGSYYLIHNLGPDSNVIDGITIAADDVTLDLSGFVLAGTTNAHCGITMESSSNRNITVKNGVVRGWGWSGLKMLDGLNCRLSGITAIENGTSPAAYSAVSVGQDWDVDDCSSSMNKNNGFSIGSGSRARNCKARGNMSYGFLASGEGCRFENCSAMGNLQDGFWGGAGTMIIGCIANSNTNKGIFVGNCSLASGNVAYKNGGLGIDAGTGSRVERNVSAQNTGGGILADGWSRVTDNQVVYNGTGVTGIRGRTACRVDGNHVFGHLMGIVASSDASGSLFVGNSAAGNTTNFFSETVNACFGQIINSDGMVPARTNFNISNPWANFELPY